MSAHPSRSTRKMNQHHGLKCSQDDYGMVKKNRDNFKKYKCGLYSFKKSKYLKKYAMSKMKKLVFKV